MKKSLSLLHCHTTFCQKSERSSARFSKKVPFGLFGQKGGQFGVFCPLPPPEGVRGAMQDHLEFKVRVPTFPKSYQLSLLNVIQEYNDHFKLSPKKGFFGGCFCPLLRGVKKLRIFFLRKMKGLINTLLTRYKPLSSDTFWWRNWHLCVFLTRCILQVSCWDVAQ